jgi:spermidine synthase
MTKAATTVDRRVPSGREVLARRVTATGDWQLQRREGHYEIICNGVFLMASYNGDSERHLARAALAAARGRALRVLAGGLGIGYTVQAVLEDPRVARCDIVEVEALVVAWHRTYFASLCGRPLDDHRTRLVVADLHDVPLDPGAYHAILLDTDNGPRWLSREVNARLYEGAGRRRLAGALAPGGVLAVWTPEGPELTRAAR